MVFHAENRLFPRICVTEHATVRECPSMSMCFLELVGLVPFTDRVRCRDRNLLSVFHAEIDKF
jgi:hypothetical protein